MWLYVGDVKRLTFLGVFVLISVPASVCSGEERVRVFEGKKHRLGSITGV